METARWAPPNLPVHAIRDDTGRFARRPRDSPSARALFADPREEGGLGGSGTGPPTSKIVCGCATNGTSQREACPISARFAGDRGLGRPQVRVMPIPTGLESFLLD